MLKRFLASLWRILYRVGVVAFFLILLPRAVTGITAWNQVFKTETVPPARVAIIFGAGLRRDGSPTAVLRDRVQTGVDLYLNGKVEKLLMSGDNSTPFYNEPEAMRQYAVSLGVPNEDIVMDFAGSRTYDTCYRANIVFGVDNALLVTQPFHLPRALFLCNSLGVNALGVEANNLSYRRSSLVIWNIREQLATLAAFFDLYVENPALTVGEPQPIFLD